MPNIKSAKKRVSVTANKTLKNKMAKSKLKTTLKTCTAQIKESKSEEALNAAYKALDKAVAKGLLHKNTASRKKSALATLYNSTEAK